MLCVVFGSVLIVGVSVFLPKLLLEHTMEAQIGTVKLAPEEYYVESGALMARKQSSELLEIDRMKLISGVWESDMRLCEKTEGFLDEQEVVELAKKQLEYYVKQGVYPHSIKTDADNMYAYTSELYCFTDSNFGIYSAYLWKLVFTRYDNRVQDVVYITECGTVLLAWTNSPDAMEGDLLDFYRKIPTQTLFGDKNLYSKKIVKEDETTLFMEIPYPEAEPCEKITESLRLSVQVSGELELFQIYEYTSAHGSGILFMPMQAEEE